MLRPFCVIVIVIVLDFANAVAVRKSIEFHKLFPFGASQGGQIDATCEARTRRMASICRPLSSPPLFFVSEILFDKNGLADGEDGFLVVLLDIRVDDEHDRRELITARIEDSRGEDNIDSGFIPFPDT